MGTISVAVKMLSPLSPPHSSTAVVRKLYAAIVVLCGSSNTKREARRPGWDSARGFFLGELSSKQASPVMKKVLGREQGSGTSNSGNW